MLTHGLSVTATDSLADPAIAGAHPPLCPGGACSPSRSGAASAPAHGGADLYRDPACDPAGLRGGDPLCGVVEADESYFGGHRKGIRGCGAAGKVPVFGLLKRRGKVYTCPVSSVSRATLRAVIRQRVPRGTTIYSDEFAGYDGLITQGYRHYRIHHGIAYAQGPRRHINGIENFWGFAKSKLQRYHGVRRSHFLLYLKEMEFRFNHRHEDFPVLIERIIKKAR